MLLTDEEIEKCREKAVASYKRHYHGTRGQQVTDADDPEMHLIWAVIAAYEAKLREQKPVEIDWPDYHYTGMGCGLEDRNITNRYEAMAYGWDCAIDAIAERIPEELFEHPAPIPEGYALVPIEPTEAMAAAGWDDAIEHEADNIDIYDIAGIYRAMLAAARSE